MGSRMVGHGASYAHHGMFRDRDRFGRRHRRFRNGFVFFDYDDDDYYYGDDGSSCYWNCRHSHGPAYCRVHAARYCY